MTDTMTATEPVGKIVLITGANQGIGFEVAKAMATVGPSYHVLMGCRSMEKGEMAASALRKQDLPVEPILLDVTNDELIVVAAEYIESKYGKLDVLINNAGIANDARLEQVGVSVRAVYAQQFDTNFFGAAQVTETFAPLLEKSSAARVVFISSRLGSLSHRADPNDRQFGAMVPVYRASKAALNMLCLHYAAKYREKDWKVNTVDPGHVATNLNRFRGPDPVTTAAVQIVRMASLGPDGPTGTFSSKECIVPW